MKASVEPSTRLFRPFLRAAVGWLVISCGLVSAFSDSRRDALSAWFLFTALALIDLVFLVKTVAAVIDLMSDQGSEKRTEYAIQAACFGSLKILGLGMIGFALWKWPEAPGVGSALGIATLIAVPLAGAIGTLVRESPLPARQQ